MDSIYEEHQIWTNVNSLVSSGDEEFGLIGEEEGVGSQVIDIDAKYNMNYDRALGGTTYGLRHLVWATMRSNKIPTLLLFQWMSIHV